MQVLSGGFGLQSTQETNPGMNPTLHKLSIHGFKSIRSLDDFELRPINILIGANGAGKSNFIEAFKFIKTLFINNQLNDYIKKAGGARRILYNECGEISLNCEFRSNRLNAGFYSCKYKLNLKDELYLSNETGRVGNHGATTGLLDIDHNIQNSLMQSVDSESHAFIAKVFSNVCIYHFNNTNEFAKMRMPSPANHNEILFPGAANIAALLYRIQDTHPQVYGQIVSYIHLAAPFFGDFHLRIDPLNPESIAFEWRQNGIEAPFLASQLSDGTLRFICLATALLQPDEIKPSTIIIDEPELGLHPSAIQLLAGMIQKAIFDDSGQKQRHQVIISTQSPQLVNEFEPEDVVVVERKEGESILQRLSTENLKEWLEDYSLGELWQKNIIGGKPRPEIQELSQGAKR